MEKIEPYIGRRKWWNCPVHGAVYYFNCFHCNLPSKREWDSLSDEGKLQFNKIEKEAESKG